MVRLATPRFSQFSGFHSKAHLIAIALVVASVVEGLLEQTGSLPLRFSPIRTLFYFELWRPFTSLFVAISPMEVIFGALIIYSVGGMLESRWSSKRFLVVALGIPLIAQVVVLLATLASPSLFESYAYASSRQIVTTLWIIFGLMAHFSHEMLNFWGTPVRGRTFALIGVGFVVLSAVFGGLMPVLPDLITVGLCYLYMYRHRIFRVKNQFELNYYEWKLKKLKKQTNLRVIEGSRSKQNVDKDDDEPGPHIH
jgi:membrane associated rhomboid family serine protease